MEYHVDARYVGNKRWNRCSVWDNQRKARRDAAMLKDDPRAKQLRRVVETQIREVPKT